MVERSLEATPPSPTPVRLQTVASVNTALMNGGFET